MNKYLKRLTESGELQGRLVVGLMSGTSLDGLDVALCWIKGYGFNTEVDLLEFETYTYNEEFKDAIRLIFSKRQVDLELLTLLNAKIGEVHANFILDALRKWNVQTSDVNFMASHGQTIYHAPQRLHKIEGYSNATLQIGDADHIAYKTGIITISDFRQKHIAAGGEGAPLALYGDCILFSSPHESRFLLNIGGISNFTYLPAGDTSGIICSDAGPGNTLIDNLARIHFNKPYDDGGRIAQHGKVITPLLIQLMFHPFFSEAFPKTTGPELFNMEYLNSAIAEIGTQDIDPADLIATVTQFTAQAIAMAIKSCVNDGPSNLFVSGGGSHNKFLLERISELLPEITIKKMDDLGISADAKEAVLFAVLANETVCGSAIEVGGGPAVMMGKISLPE